MNERNTEVKNYRYVGTDETGKKKRGKIKAYNVENAKSVLRKEGIAVNKIKENDSGLMRLDDMMVGSAIKPRQLEYYLNQLAALLKSEVNLIDACEMLAEQEESKRFKPILMDIFYKVSLGKKLSEVMGEYPEEFPALLQRMVAVGEMTGNLTLAVEEAKHRITKQEELKKAILSAMTMPLIYYFVAFVVVIYMSISVFPTFGDTFEGLDNFKMPFFTQMFINFGIFIKGNWSILIIVVATIAIGWWLLMKKVKPFKKWIHSVFLRVPLLKGFIKLREQALIAGTLSMLVNAKLDFIEALLITKATVSSEVYKDILERIIINVSAGGKISEVIEDDKYMDRLFVKMVMVGESTSDLPRMLKTTAEFYDKDATIRINIIRRALEPVMLIVVYSVIVALFLALMLPSFNVTF